MSADTSPSLEEPIRIVSDLHLGHPASLVEEVASLEPVLAGARTVIFNGDTCELAYHGWRAEGEERLEALRSLCERLGARAVFLAGNHDPHISEQGWAELHGGAILVTHGHAMYPDVAPWTPECIGRRKEVRELLKSRGSASGRLSRRWETTRAVTDLLRPDHKGGLGRKGRKYVWSAAWPPRRSFEILRVWLGMVGAAESFVETFRPATRVCLFGHFHRSGVWERDGRVFCNSGAFMRGTTPWVGSLHEGWLDFSRVQKAGRDFRIGESGALLRLAGGAQSSRSA